VILSAKHGQSPMDPTTLKRVDEATLQARLTTTATTGSPSTSPTTLRCCG